MVPKPYGIGDGTKKEVSDQPKKFPKAAITLACITLIAGLALGLVNFMTADIIEEQNAAAKAASYVEVIPTADEVNYDDDLTALVDEAAAASDYYADSAFGKVKVNEAVVGTDASGNVVGYAISVSTADGYGDSITLSVGIDTEGTILGLSFTELEETAGLGMRADEDSFKSQFVGVQVDSFTLNKSGGSTADDEIDSISGASTTSGAVVNAVNAAIDFFANYIQ
ncbi:MAG: RnfABCDGE type electron transport complex subunit G [Clostridiales bacterium]|nr:RnfABCDGE type electron transport complex subunit G [Clostridiales bacterium]